MTYLNERNIIQSRSATFSCIENRIILGHLIHKTTRIADTDYVEITVY